MADRTDDATRVVVCSNRISHVFGFRKVKHGAVAASKVEGGVALGIGLVERLRMYEPLHGIQGVPELFIDGVFQVEALWVHRGKATQWTGKLHLIAGLDKDMPGVGHLGEEIAGRLICFTYGRVIGDYNEDRFGREADVDHQKAEKVHDVSFHSH